jgi:hypothetical protein
MLRFEAFTANKMKSSWAISHVVVEHTMSALMVGTEEVSKMLVCSSAMM